MCTAIFYKTGNSYFGRTLDLEKCFDERITVTPRNFRFDFRRAGSIENHHAIVGIATVKENFPLYYEGANEWGLGIAGLNFPENVFYSPEVSGKDNVSPFEFIPWILSQCKDVSDTRKLLERINICNINFSSDLPLSPLHWMISDKNSSITVEPLREGLKIYENPVGVLTNNPPFDYQMTYLADFMNTSPYSKANTLGNVRLDAYSRGLGGKGLPGDFSSTSRFVKASFVKENSVSGKGENESVGQFFHILGSVEQVRGSVRVEKDENVITQYTSCINLDKGIYYYTTYENRCISAVCMHNCNLDGRELFNYPLAKNMIVNRQNY